MPCIFTQRPRANAYTSVRGNNCSATAKGAYAAGNGCAASGIYSRATGIGTIVTEAGQHAIGTYNAVTPGALLMVGNGTSTQNRSNAFTVYKDGTVKIGNSSMVVTVLDVSEPVQACGGFAGWFSPASYTGLSRYVQDATKRIIDSLEASIPTPAYLSYSYTGTNGSVDQRMMPCTVTKESSISSDGEVTISTFYVYFSFTGNEAYSIRIIRKWFADNHVEYNWSTITGAHTEYPEGTSWIVDMEAAGAISEV